MDMDMVHGNFGCAYLDRSADEQNDTLYVFKESQSTKLNTWF